jgi:hypothetical protein
VTKCHPKERVPLEREAARLRRAIGEAVTLALPPKEGGKGDTVSLGVVQSFFKFHICATPSISDFSFFLF